MTSRLLEIQADLDADRITVAEAEEAATEYLNELTEAMWLDERANERDTP